MRRLAVMCLIGFGVVASPVAAQQLIYDQAKTDVCLKDGGTVLDCAGDAAAACMQDTPGGYSTVGMGGCLDQELRYWDARLNAAYQRAIALAKQGDTENQELGLRSYEVAERLRHMQRAWIPYRDALCDFERSKWGGGTGGGPATLMCLLHETARQTAVLEREGT